jgi:L-threonylcarbamoyladenylate synthase
MPRESSSNARILSTHTPVLFEAAVAAATRLLCQGEVVALPTETVYGLAANALDPQAVSRIFQIKERPADNPLIVHIASPDMARQCARTWTTLAAQLGVAFWPGPLTLVVERAPIIPDIVTAGGGTVGLRWPSHPFIQAVIRACGFPLATPSANRSNELSPTTAEHVQRSLGHRVPLIVDGGSSQIGIESTVVDATGTYPRILRPGMIHLESILAAIPDALGEDEGDVAPGDSPTATTRAGTGASLDAAEAVGHPIRRSPGLLSRHYAPRARLFIEEWTRPAELSARLRARSIQSSECHVIAHTCIPPAEPFASVRVIPHDAEAYARAIYAELHRCDQEGARAIVVEAVPRTPEWQGIADRLRRAAE